MSVAGIAAILASSMAQAATLTMTGGTVGTVTAQQTSDPIDSTYFYEDCYSPVNILLDSSETTASVDVKLFATGFDIQEAPASYSGFYTGGLFTTFYAFTNRVGDIGHRITTWTAQSGSYSSTEYLYFNAYSADYADAEATVWNERLATLYLKPKAWETAGQLMFYYLTNENLDDSNVSSGTNTETTTGYTQYVDALNWVAGTWNYAITASYACPFRPYIDDGANYYFTLGTGLTNYVNTSNTDPYTNHNSGGAIAPLTKFNPTSGPYSGYITLSAWADVTSTNMTDRYYWTNQPITVTISGNDSQEIAILNSNLATSSYVSVAEWLGTGNWDNVKTITITGQVEDSIDFVNRIGNTWDTYNGYVNEIEINTFFYDTTGTVVVTGVIATGEGYSYIWLSGYEAAGTSSETNGRHATRTDHDDIFRITKFSGYNTLSYGQSTTTSYNDELDALYVANNDEIQNFSMTRTGINSNEDIENPVATQTWAILFTETWHGWVYYSDIAGNTGRVYIDIEVEPKITFEIRGTPAFRDEAWTKILTGDIRLARDNGTAREFTHNSNEILSHSKVTLNANGTGSISWVVPASGQEFLVVFKGTWMTAVGFTGIWGTNTTDAAIIDFTSGTNNTGMTINDVYPKVTYGPLDYIIAWDIATSTAGAYDYINSADLSLINSNLSIGVLPSNINHYDFDLNEYINAIEQGIVINYNDFNGWIYEFGGYNGSTHIYPSSGDFTTNF